MYKLIFKTFLFDYDWVSLKLEYGCDKHYTLVKLTAIYCTTKSKEHIFLKLKKTAPRLNFGRFILKNNYDINFNVNKNLEILNTQENFYINKFLY